ncbi:MAG: hypothetical protein EU544_03300, partial [Promethearchaeota archaeon]
MVEDIFGGTVPFYYDAIISLLLPQGSFVFLNLLLISVGLGVFFVSRYLYDKLGADKTGSFKQSGLIWLLLLMVGLFITVLLSLILITLLCLSISRLFKVKKDISTRDKIEPEKNIKSQKMNFLVIILISLNILMLLIFSIGGLLLAFLLGWWVYGWMLQIGVVIGIGIVIANKLLKIEPLKKNRIMGSKSKLVFKGAILLIIILFSGVFIITLIPNAHIGIPDKPTSDEPTNLMIMTYNIRLGTGIEEDPANQWFNRKEEFVEYLDSFDLDVFGIQEAQFFQIEYIHENLESREYSWTGRARDNGVYDGEACAIFYDSEKFEFIDGDTFWLSDLPDYPSNTFGGNCYRVVTWVRLELTTGESKGAQFVVFNTHYD